MGDILIIGNGFDLAHNLPTKYTDYLFLVKNITSFEKEFQKREINGVIDKDNRFNKYFYDEIYENREEIYKFIELAKNNPWIRYFSNCEAEIKGWIDFEKEILPICNAFDTLFDADFKEYKTIEKDGQQVYYVAIENWYDMLKLILWENLFLPKRSGNTIFIKEEYASIRQGFLKDKIIKELRESFIGFKKSMLMYMRLFINTQSINISNQIKSLNPDYVVSFNYTEVEKNYYSLQKNRVCHVHGSISMDSIVLGTDLIKDDSKYVFLTKRFQRLTNVKDFSYKTFIAAMGKNTSVDIIGHSLDENDKQIFEPFIRKSNVTNIYYYNNEDYENKIINLLKVFGGDWVENRVFQKQLFFKELKEF
jgi:hypothetical protein